MRTTQSSSPCRRDASSRAPAGRRPARCRTARPRTIGRSPRRCRWGATPAIGDGRSPRASWRPARAPGTAAHSRSVIAKLKSIGSMHRHDQEPECPVALRHRLEERDDVIDRQREDPHDGRQEEQQAQAGPVAERVEQAFAQPGRDLRVPPFRDAPRFLVLGPRDHAEGRRGVRVVPALGSIHASFDGATAVAVETPIPPDRYGSMTRASIGGQSPGSGCRPLGHRPRPVDPASDARAP